MKKFAKCILKKEITEIAEILNESYYYVRFALKEHYPQEYKEEKQRRKQERKEKKKIYMREYMRQKRKSFLTEEIKEKVIDTFLENITLDDYYEKHAEIIATQKLNLELEKVEKILQRHCPKYKELQKLRDQNLTHCLKIQHNIDAKFLSS